MTAPLIGDKVRGYLDDRGPDGIWIPWIVSEEEGFGNVGRYLDTLPADRRVVFVDVISPILVDMLKRRGFVESTDYDPDRLTTTIWERNPTT